MKNKDNNMSKHTKTPWVRTHKKTLNMEGMLHVFIRSVPGNETIGRIDGYPEREEEFEATVDFILTACNMHDELVANLEYMIRFIKSRSWSAMPENVIDTEVEALDHLLARVKEQNDEE